MHIFHRISTLCRPNQPRDLTLAPFTLSSKWELCNVIPPCRLYGSYKGRQFRSAADPPADVVTEP